MNSHHRADQLRVLGLHRVEVLFGQTFVDCSGEGVGEVVTGLQPVDKRPHRLGQIFIGFVHVGEASVAPHFGHHHRSQDGAERWFGHVGVVAVPPGSQSPHRGDLVEHGDLRMSVQFGTERRHVDGAESLTEGQMLVGRDGLVAEEHHQVVEQGLADSGHGGVVEFLAQVNPVDLGTYV